MLSRSILTLALSAGVLSAAAFANTSVHGQISAYIVSQDAKGQEKVIPAEQTEPGQTMEFQIVFTNDGETNVKGIQVIDPVPENTQYIGTSNHSDVPAMFEVSIDGGVTFESEPVYRIETQADGTQKRVVIPASQYTHLRWTPEQELASNGGQQRYIYRVSVN